MTKFRKYGYVLPAAAVIAWSVAAPAGASFHLYKFDQVYSDACGTVQFVELAAGPLDSGQEFFSVTSLTASQGLNSRNFPFPSDLPATPAHSTANSKFIIATQAFAALGIVTPDYVVPNGFFYLPNGTITVNLGGDSLAYGPLPVDGNAVNRTGTPVTPSPTNFAGATGSLPPPTTAGVFDVDGNGQVDALTDGLMSLRYLFGIRGPALTQGALGQCATRNTPELIESHIGGLIPPP